MLSVLLLGLLPLMQALDSEAAWPSGNEWRWAKGMLTAAECEQKCTELKDSWGCNFVSTTTSGHCFIHKDCTHQDLLVDGAGWRAPWLPGE